MDNFITISSAIGKELHQIDSRMVSYNVEMAEVTGGTFWKAYTREQVEGKEDYPPIKSMADIAGMMQVYPPINLYNQRLRYLAKMLGPAWVRVSGSWATKTYYDFDGHTGGKVPEGYQNILTEEQWKGVLDFVKEVDGKLLISVSNCEGLHSAKEEWHPEQAKLILDYSANYGVPVEAIEFTNEPNMLEHSGLPAGYTPSDYARDQDVFVRFIRENYPDILIVGPCTTGGDVAICDETEGPGSCKVSELMEGTSQKLDVFSYHYYNGVSERLASVMPKSHWDSSLAHTEEYLDKAISFARTYAPIRDLYVPGGQMWVTESGDAGGGGNTWASTYLEVFRVLNELGGFSTITDGVIFHNTLASSDYGFLAPETFEPRPSYFAVSLWNRLMGNVVYETGESIREGVHVYAHSRKDGKPGKAYLIINNSAEKITNVTIPTEAECYILSGENDSLRARTMLVNGKPMKLDENDKLPNISPVYLSASNLELKPLTIAFVLL